MNKQNIKILIIYFFTLLSICLILTFNGYLLADRFDYINQHFVFADNLRKLFYESFDLLPDFLFNQGSGQNIYNISYYGLLNPYILFSYLVPFIPMIYYMGGIMFLVLLSSAFLFYLYLLKNNFKSKTAIVLGFMLLCSSTMICHMYKQVMFISYMPFLIIAMFGVDQYINNKKSLTLIVALSLILFTSYYFALPCFIIVFLFGIYKYYKINELDIKKDIKWCLKFIIPFALAGFSSAVLIFPTLYIILTSRTDSNSFYTFIDFLIPVFKTSYFKDGTGLTLSAMFVLICSLCIGKKIDKIFIIFILFMISCPLVIYILNGGIYIHEKATIPFAPFLLFMCGIGLDKIFDNNNSYRQKYIMAYFIATSYIVCLIVNFSARLESFDDFNNERNIIDQLSSKIEYDSIIRVNDNYSTGGDVNTLSSYNNYKTTLYSSTSNLNYLDFYYNTMLNNYQTDLEFVISSSDNIFSQILLSEKYIISQKELGLGYKKVSKYDGVYLYENLYSLPLGYATSNSINSTIYETLSAAEKVINLTTNVLTDSFTSDNIIHNTNKLNYNDIIDTTLNLNDSNKFTIGTYSFNFKESLLNKVLYVKFDVEQVEYLQYIKCNGQLNTISKTNYIYDNKNTSFEFFLLEPSNLTLEFLQDSSISNFEFELIDFNEIISSMSYDEFVIDKSKTSGDIIYGEIDVTEDSFFTLSIPYDEGFTILVDGVETEYEICDTTFIGFNISEGYHTIEIIYEAPLKNISLVISLISVFLIIGLSLIENRFKKTL